jgi:hypothetical protein
MRRSASFSLTGKPGTSPCADSISDAGGDPASIKHPQSQLSQPDPESQPQEPEPQPPSDAAFPLTQIDTASEVLAPSPSWCWWLLGIPDQYLSLLVNEFLHARGLLYLR